MVSPIRWQSEHWNQLVEDFFPLEVSQLFFFDAEKIRSLAEDETSSQVLGAAVKSLLGLDVAERLIADAGVLEARLAKGLEATKSQDDRGELEKDIDRAQDRARRAEDKAQRAREHPPSNRNRGATARRGVQGRGWKALGSARPSQAQAGRAQERDQRMRVATSRRRRRRSYRSARR